MVQCGAQGKTGVAVRLLQPHLHNKFTISGGNDEGVPPVPIPNTEVKPFSADGTWLETARESRSLPESNCRSSKELLFFSFRKKIRNAESGINIVAAGRGLPPSSLRSATSLKEGGYARSKTKPTSRLFIAGRWVQVGYTLLLAQRRGASFMRRDPCLEISQLSPALSAFSGRAREGAFVLQKLPSRKIFSYINSCSRGS